MAQLETQRLAQVRAKRCSAVVQGSPLIRINFARALATHDLYKGLCSRVVDCYRTPLSVLPSVDVSYLLKDLLAQAMTELTSTT